MNTNMNELQFAFYESLFNAKPDSLASLSTLQSLIKGNSLCFKTSEVRRLTGEGRDEEARRVKLSLPAVAVYARFDGKRCKENILSLTHCGLIDIDHATRPPAEIVTLCQSLPYVLLAHVSVRGKGVHLVVRLSGKTARWREDCIEIGEAIERLTGEQVDPACFELSRTMLLSHDPDCYVNPEAKPYQPVARCEEPRPEPSAEGGIQAYLDKADANLDWQEGCRHTTLVSLAASLNRAGFGVEEAVGECVRRYVQPTFKEAEISKTIRSICDNNPGDFGTRSRATRRTKKDKNATCPSRGEDFKEKESLLFDEEDVSLKLPLIPVEVYQRLPRALRRLLKPGLVNEEKDTNLLALLTLLSSVMPGVKGSYRQAICYPQLFSYILAEPGSGKGQIEGIRVILSQWHGVIHERSKKEVRKYEEAMEEYNFKRTAYLKSGKGEAPEKPEPVYLKRLNIAPDVTNARLKEQLEHNGHYPSIMHTSELSVVVEANSMDYGKFASTFNQIFHNEKIERSTKHEGSNYVECPKMAWLATGTPMHLTQLIDNLSDGLFSRCCGYLITGLAPWGNLTDEDDTPDAAEFYKQHARWVMELGLFLDNSPTWVSLTCEQRDRVNLLFSQWLEEVDAIGNEHLRSMIFRMGNIFFRYCIIFTAIRKFESQNEEEYFYVHPDDFEAALAIVKVHIAHGKVIATLLENAKPSPVPCAKSNPERMLHRLPDTFETGDAKRIAQDLSISERNVARYLKRWVESGLIIKQSYGCYSKSETGRNYFSQK